MNTSAEPFYAMRNGKL